MNQGTPLWRIQALGEQLPLALEAFGQWQLGGRLDRRDATQWREQPRHALGDFSVLGANQGIVISALKALSLLAGTAWCAAFLDHTTGVGKAGSYQLTLENLIDDIVLDRLVPLTIMSSAFSTPARRGKR